MTSSLVKLTAALSTAAALGGLSGCTATMQAGGNLIRSVGTDIGNGVGVITGSSSGQQAPVSTAQQSAGNPAAASAATDCPTLAENKTPQVLGKFAFVQNAAIGCKFAKVAGGEFAPVATYSLSNSREATAYAKDYDSANKQYTAALKRSDSQEAREDKQNNPFRLFRDTVNDVSGGVSSAEKLKRAADRAGRVSDDKT